MANVEKVNIKSKFIRMDNRDYFNLIDSIKKMMRVRAHVGIFNKKVAKYMTDMEKGGFFTIEGKHVFVPPRPWLSRAMVEKENKVKKMLVRNMVQIFNRGGRRRLTFKDSRTVVKKAAAILEKHTKNLILSKQIIPPLAALTVVKKEEANLPMPDTPLFATGLAYSLIKTKIVIKRSGETHAAFEQRKAKEAALKQFVRDELKASRKRIREAKKLVKKGVPRKRKAKKVKVSVKSRKKVKK